MKSRVFILVATIVALSLLSACGGSGGGSSAVTAVPAPVTAGGGGPSNASNVVYSPHATIYRETYTGSAPPAQAGPFSPLAVTPDGSTVYFFDYSFGAVQFANGAFTLHPPQQNVQSGGTSWFVGGPLAVDALGNVYESAYCMPGQNPCAFGYATSPFTSSVRIVQTGSTSSNQAFYDLENTTNGTLLGAGPDLRLTTITNPSSSSPTVQHVTLPGSSLCAYRTIQGTQNDYYVSTCANNNQIDRYSASLALLKSVTVPNAHNISEITPDTTGGVWFADKGNFTVGRVSPSGTVTMYTGFPADFVPMSVTTAQDGSIWAGGSLNDTHLPTGAIAHIVPGGTAEVYPIGQYFWAEDLKGTFGFAHCGFSGLYARDSNGDIAVITLI